MRYFIAELYHRKSGKRRFGVYFIPGLTPGVLRSHYKDTDIAYMLDVLDIMHALINNPKSIPPFMNDLRCIYEGHPHETILNPTAYDPLEDSVKLLPLPDQIKFPEREFGGKTFKVLSDKTQDYLIKSFDHNAPRVRRLISLLARSDKYPEIKACLPPMESGRRHEFSGLGIGN